MYAAVAIVICYLVGAIPVGLLVARAAGIKDVRQVGSGNIGATNVWRVAGFKIAIWVFIFDIGKGVVAVLFGELVAVTLGTPFPNVESFLVVCGLAAIVGNVFPIYLKFRGGKGVNTSLGVVLTLLPLATAISFGVFVVVVLLFRYISLGSILAGVTLSAVVLVQRFALAVPVADVFIVLAAALSLLVLFTHRSNIARLVAGQENRFSFSSRNSEGKS